MEDEQIPPETPSPASKYPNLKPIQPGEVRNPKGKKPGTLNVKTILAKWLGAKEDIANPITGKKQRLTQVEIMTMVQIKAARNGDLSAYNALLDRLDGKPVQKSILTGVDDTPLIPTEKTVMIVGGKEIEF